MDTAYKFRQRCVKSKTTLTDNITQLHQVSNISGAANGYLTDINTFDEVKEEYQKENSIEKTEMFIKVNEDSNEEETCKKIPITEIKRENNPISLKLIETEHYIQLGNVIKMEQKNQNSDEDIETLDNILVNLDDNKINISQNDIKLTVNTIKKENENQDFVEHLHVKFDNILETFDNANGNMVVKIEKSEDYPLYSEKYSDNPLATLDGNKIGIVNNDIEEFSSENNEISLEDQDKVKLEENDDYHSYSEKCFDDPSSYLDEIKIDIVDNDIELMNNEINFQYKSEDIEEFSTDDNDLSLEDENKTDKDANFIHKSLEGKQKQISLMKMPKQKKKCDVINQKMKIVKNQECNVCKKNLYNSSSLNRHMTIHTGEKLHECSICQKKFTHSSYLKQHLKIHTGVKPHECSVCKMKFTHSSTLKDHMKIHTGVKPHECSVCQKKFNRSSNLQNHLKFHTEVKPHECSVCPKKFTQLSHLKDHLNIHTGVKPHECSVCQKKYIQLANLKEHLKIHTGVKPHKCNVCQKKFTHSSTLKQHLKIHTGVKSHQCSVCQNKFTQKFHLERHMRIHTGIKPYECSVCWKKFTHSSTLKNHLKIHTGKKLH